MHIAPHSNWPQRHVPTQDGHRPTRLITVHSVVSPVALKEGKEVQVPARVPCVQSAPQFSYSHFTLITFSRCTSVTSLVSLTQKLANSEDLRILSSSLWPMRLAPLSAGDHSGTCPFIVASGQLSLSHRRSVCTRLCAIFCVYFFANCVHLLACTLP